MDVVAEGEGQAGRIGISAAERRMHVLAVMFQLWEWQYIHASRDIAC
jgi:hypothetical protein